MSRMTAAHSMTKMWLTEVKPVGRAQPPPEAALAAATLMSMAAWPSIDPATPLSACCRAASTSRWRRTAGTATASSDDHDRAADELGQGELPAHAAAPG